MSVLPPVSVTPPLRNCGSVFCRSPVDLKPQSDAVSRLWPSEVMTSPAAQLEGVAPLDTVFDATIVFSTEIELPAPASRPPPFGLAVPPSFAAIVELVIVTVLALHPYARALDRPAARRRRVADERRVVDRRRRARPGVVDPSALTAAEARVVLDAANASRSRCRSSFAIPPPRPPVVSPSSMQSSLRVSVPRLRTLPPRLPLVDVRRCLAEDDVETGDRRGHAGLDVEDTRRCRGGLLIDLGGARAAPHDRHVLGDRQLPGGQRVRMLAGTTIVLPRVRCSPTDATCTCCRSVDWRSRPYRPLTPP